MAPWEVEFDPRCGEWAISLDQGERESLLATINVLRRLGPQLGRPLVDSIRYSRHRNMKELRPPSSGRSEVRVLFAFDPERRAILLLGGDKRGSWSEWYRKNVPIADDRYDQHLAALKETPRGSSEASKRRARDRRRNRP